MSEKNSITTVLKFAFQFQVSDETLILLTSADNSDAIVKAMQEAYRAGLKAMENGTRPADFVDYKEPK